MKELFEIDELQQYCGFGLHVCDGLDIKQPTVGDIIKMGEIKYFSMVYTLTAIPSDMKAQLDQCGIDWEKIEDFELFCMLATKLQLSDTSVLFGDLDFTKFEIVVPNEGERLCYLRHSETGVVIDEIRYLAIRNYLCNMHGIKKKPQLAGNAYTHKMLLEMAYEDLKKTKTQPKSSLKPLISTLVNMPGFKYNLKEVMEIGFNQFMDAVSRIQVINSAQALLQGCYSGNIDVKKLNKSELNYMRDIK